jgi:hypothetical protein
VEKAFREADLIENPRSDPRNDSQEMRIDRLERALEALTNQIARLQFPSPSPNPTPNPPSAPAVSVRNRRCAEVLLVDSNRLRDRTAGFRPDQVASLTTIGNQVRSRLDGYFFSVEPALSVLPCLRQLVNGFDPSYLSGASVLWIVDDFIRSPANEAFRSQQFNSWPTAVTGS